MSQITMLANTTGTGVFTIQTPGTNTNRTVTLPDQTATLATTADIPSTLNATGTAPLYACRAWVNFNGTGTVSTNQTIRTGGNVASVFKNAAGTYTINFTTPMPTTNYAIVASAQRSTTTAPVYVGISPSVTPTTSAVQITVAATAANIEDSAIVTVVVFC